MALHSLIECGSIPWQWSPQFHNIEEPIVAQKILWITKLAVISKSNCKQPIVARRVINHNASCGIQSSQNPTNGSDDFLPLS